jgi:hypothetical protein
VPSPRKTRDDVVDPKLLANLAIVGWIYVACAGVGAIAFSILTSLLPASTWYALGMVSYIQGAVHLFLLPSGVLAAMAWIAFVVLAVIVIVSWRFGRPSRPGLVALEIFAFILFGALFVDLLVSAALQVGDAVAVTESRANSGILPAAVAGAYVSAAVTIGAAYLVVVRSRRARTAKRA